MTVFLLECREDKEKTRQFPRKGFPTHCRDDDQFCQWCHFNRNSVMSNNIIIVILSAFSFHITAVYTETCTQSQCSGVCD